MPHALRRLLVLLFLPGVLLAGTGKKKPAVAQSLAKTEVAFAKLSVERGMDRAFLTYLSDAAVILRPGPVNGKEWIRAHPAPPIVLNWHPALAEVSHAGDLGYTTGPFSVFYPADTSKGKQFGEFATVWARQRDNSWKAIFDIGISHPPPSDVADLMPATDMRQAPQGAILQTASLQAERARVLSRDASLFRDSLSPAPASGILTLLAPDARIFRNGNFPIIGVDAARTYFAHVFGTMLRRPIAGEVARSGDLAYTYGSFRFRGEDTKVPTRGYYLTIWKKNPAGDWMIALDVESIIRM